MLHYSSLINKKNLLAFSAGIDSSALFFYLMELDISFDIAIVDYGLRSSAKAEVSHATSLAQQYNIQIYTAKAPHYDSNFEANARRFRYNFFEELVDQHSYDSLLTAHQLNDQLEWFLMRLTKGAGVSELLGLESRSIRKTKNNNSYTLLRPLLDTSRDELLQYLDKNSYPYFIDESNRDPKYERNRFRARFAEPLMSEFVDGIKRSFKYLQKDKESLLDGITLIYSQYELRVYQLRSPSLRVKCADIALKELGYLLSAKQRIEIDENRDIVIGGKWTVVYQDHILYISPFLKTDMSKHYRELCRVSSLPSKIRAYCYHKGIRPTDVMSS